MAVFEVVEGPPGQGKSLYTARTARWLLKRNKKIFARIGVKRKIASNIRFSDAFEKEAGDFLMYWADSAELVKLRDVDVLWDEIATDLDSRNWLNLSNDLKIMLSQYRKRGMDIYANTQDFSMVDARARLMITGVKRLTKILGSGDPSATKPVIKTIWGLVLVRKITNWKETDLDKKKYELIPSFFMIDRRDVELYDTTQDIIQSAYPAFKHVVRYCDDPNCKLHHEGKVVHI